MKIIYKGGLAEGYVRDAKGREYPFEKGKPVEVPDETGRELCKLEDWQAAAGKETK